MQRRRDCGRYVFRHSPRRGQPRLKGAGRPPKNRRGKLSKSTKPEEVQRLKFQRRGLRRFLKRPIHRTI